MYVKDGNSLVIGGPLLELCPVQAFWHFEELLDGLVLGGPLVVDHKMVGGGVGTAPIGDSALGNAHPV